MKTHDRRGVTIPEPESRHTGLNLMAKPVTNRAGLITESIMFKLSRSLLLMVLLSGTFSVVAADGGIESLRETSKAFASVSRSVSPSVALRPVAE